MSKLTLRALKKKASINRAQLLANIDQLIVELINIHGRLRKEAEDPENPLTSTVHITNTKEGIEKAVQNLKNQRSYISRLGQAAFPQEV